METEKEVAFKKAELIRVPIRLGEDAFLKGKIGERKVSKLVKAMKAFRYLIDVYDAVPAPIHKLAGLIRGQLLVQSTQRKPLRIFLRRWMKEISNLNESGVRFVLDVDPIDV